MATTSHPGSTHHARSMWADGLIIFAGTVLATVGLLQFFEGLAAVLNDQLYVQTRDYVYQFDLTTWGWIHLIVGLVGLAVGIAMLTGQSWAYITGVVIASLSTVTQFLFLPWFPVWALVVIVFDLAVIWALCVKLGSD